MGSPEEAGIVDWGVGSIVWVRRRNGSWWPGKILGPEELSAAHLMSPRSGTPVKLLGREDASVDWYNLEKSKRVKAFRCGEFDECIERAETSLGMPPKKREKYARREDAILHALELEKQLLNDKAVKIDPPANGNSNKSSDVVRKELVISSECSSFDIRKDSSLQHDCKKLDSECEDTNIDVQKVNGGSQMGGDDDNSELLPRMRGVLDFGAIAPSKRKLASSTSSNGSRKLEHDNLNHDLPIRGLLKENTVILGMRNSLTKKRKPPSDVLTDESLVRRRDKCRPLLQVLQSSEKLPSKSSLQLEDTGVPTHISGEERVGPTSNAKRSSLHLPSKCNDCSDEDKLLCPDQMEKSPAHVEEEDYFPQHSALPDQSGSESTESTETDTSETESLNREGDDEMVGLSDPALVVEMEPKSLGISEEVRPGSTNCKLRNDDDVPHDPVPASLGGSKWQIKGKRNNRSVSRRSTEVTDGWAARGSMYGAELEEVEGYGFDETDIIERNFRTRRRPFYDQGYLLTPKAPSRGYDDGLHNIIDWEDLAWNERPFTRAYLDGPSNYLDPTLGGHRFGGRMKSGLVDVDLKVQSSYQREHVPMISLMSKLNGQAIVGHPIQVEVLESGSSDSLLLTAGREISDNDIAVPAAWRTARRTANFRVPRSHPSTADEEDAELLQNVSRYRKTPSTKSALKASGARKGLSRGKISRKRPKGSLSSSQKIKNLSSIVQEQKLGNNFRDGNKASFKVGGLMKGEPGPTAVACIPVKLVFSRLNEELAGRHQ